jgi:sulfatase modifying factor 1
MLLKHILFCFSIFILVGCATDTPKAQKSTNETDIGCDDITLPATIHGLKTMRLVRGNTYPVSAISNPNKTIEVKQTGYYMDETPVTYADFELYNNEGGRETAYWKYDSYNKPNQPITGISWYQAADYCNWRSDKEGLIPAYIFNTSDEETDHYGYPSVHIDSLANGYRLPTETQFEIAARAGFDIHSYPWGDHFNDTLANYDTDKGFKSSEWWRLADVKSQYQNAYGFYNISGNNWHWCENWHDENQRTKALRGGSWGSIDSSHLTIETRSHSSPSNYNYEIGFRCVRSTAGINFDTDTLEITELIDHGFYFPPKFSDIDNVQPIVDYCSEAFTKKLAQYIGDNYPECIYFQMQIDEQEILTPQTMAELIVDVCCEQQINPLFLTAIMISESGFASCSFPRWYNSPMAYHWQNKLMAKGLPVYESLPGKRNRKYKTLRIGFNAFCKGINWSPYYKASRTDLYAFHRVYVGYEAKQWMHTLTRVFNDVVGVRFEPHYPKDNCGELIYLNWDKLK